MERGRRIKEEIRGILSIIAGLVVIISLASHNPWDRSLSTYSPELKNLLGSFGSNLSEILLQTVGLASYIFPVLFLLFGTRKLFGRPSGRKWTVPAAAITVLVFSTSSFITLAFNDYSGGALGILASNLALKAFSTTGSYLLFITLILVSLMYLLRFSVADTVKAAANKTRLGLRALSAARPKRKEAEHPRIEAEETDMPEPLYEYEQEPLPLTYPEIKTMPRLKTVTKTAAKTKGGDYELPGTGLLKDPPPSRSRPSKEELLERSELLEKKLRDYSIEGKVTYVSPGPIVTMFEFEPAPGIKISRIMSLADDLSMALKASSIRISPIHGRSTLGIEVPNRDREDVFLKDVISSEAFSKSHSKLTLALGKDIFGIPVMADLGRMPHLLIAGATGSGKSVGMNTIVLSLLFRATPGEVKMLMIDPKMLELSAYEEIPHLLMPVITLPKEASNALKRLVIEMERRYRLLADSGARNIEAYNKKVEAASRTGPGDGAAAGEMERLPYIVIFIDEFADLMFASGREVEDSIARLAQMARAAGIHLILATQRPSVDVITGIIKANFPSRISFQVSSKLDSRIILDTYGADQLLGKGDMLLTSPGKKIKRIHGAYVSEEEIRNVVNFIKNQAGHDYTLLKDLAVDLPEETETEGRDKLYREAKEFVLAAGQASISSIQRRMKIGYNRAARIMDMLEEEGIVGPPGEAGKPREVIRRR